MVDIDHFIFNIEHALILARVYRSSSRFSILDLIRGISKILCENYQSEWYSRPRIAENLKEGETDFSTK